MSYHSSGIDEIFFGTLVQSRYQSNDIHSHYYCSSKALRALKIAILTIIIQCMCETYVDCVELIAD